MKDADIAYNYERCEGFNGSEGGLTVHSPEAPGVEEEACHNHQDKEVEREAQLPPAALQCSHLVVETCLYPPVEGEPVG